MAKERKLLEERATTSLRQEPRERRMPMHPDYCADVPRLAHPWPSARNRVVQCLLTQGSGLEEPELDKTTAECINLERGSGQPLEGTTQKQLSGATGIDFSGVQVHTSPEADDLSRQLNAKAFTTGRDIFFREGAYDPHSNSGRELIAHELTHVVQQSSGQVGGGSSGKMMVNAPDDEFEKEADAVAKAVTAPGATARIQRQAAEPMEEEEEAIQTKNAEGVLQMQVSEPLEEEAVQRQELAEEEEVEELPT